MNKLKYCVLLGVVALGFSSCLKDKAFVDLTSTQPIIEFPIVSPTIATYSWGSLSGTEVDTAIAVDIASPQVLNYAVTVTISWDTTQISAYNAANSQFPIQPLPDSCFSIASPITVTIPAGYRIGRIPLKIYPSRINSTVSYGMPFKISAVSGSGPSLLISPNAGTLMYTFIGNPIAGAYTQEYIRYNTATQTGTPVADQTTPGALFTPVTPTEITATSGIGVIYDLKFTSTNGVPDPGSFSLSLVASSVTAVGITISAGPTIVTADPVNGIYKFNYQYLNSSGAARNITDIFTR
jgi:hypothetical protein